MSVLQSDHEEVRYLKRKGLEEESRIIGNALRDQIRQYGIDCTYYKLNESFATDFKGIVDQNTVLKRAYGYEVNPDYTMSASMITYADAQQDIFMMNKLGFQANAELDFNFDKIDFACALAPKCGQLREYEIDRRAFVYEVPDMPEDVHLSNGISSLSSSQLSVFPYEIGLDSMKTQYTCSMLSGKFRAIIWPYEYGKEYTIVCDPYEHTSFNVTFPANSDLYRSLKYKIENDDYLETHICLTYKVCKIDKGDGLSASILSGYVHGSVLFYDIQKLGKYLDLIRPAVGDIIEIDFPDDQNREKYEVTDCFDKQLTQDGISPLLHKYIWKCKARRYINSYEDNTPHSEADDRIDEMHKFNQVVDEEVADKKSMYDIIGKKTIDVLDEVSGYVKKEVDVKEDAAYGGYDGTITEYDIMKPGPERKLFNFIDDGTAIDLVRFNIGSRILTTGYELLFMDKAGIFYEIAMQSVKPQPTSTAYQGDLRWLKATDSQVVFVNIDGESTQIACDYEATKGEIELCLNSLYDKTVNEARPITLDDVCLDAYDEKKLNTDYSNFYKFRGTKTYLWSDGMHLYAKLASSKMLYKIV